MRPALKTALEKPQHLEEKAASIRRRVSSLFIVTGHINVRGCCKIAILSQQRHASTKTLNGCYVTVLHLHRF